MHGERAELPYLSDGSPHDVGEPLSTVEEICPRFEAAGDGLCAIIIKVFGRELFRIAV